MAEWKFRRMQKSEKLKDPTETEFFTTEDVGSLSAALVRESIQNSMDARVDKKKPSKVRFVLPSKKNAINPSEFEDYFQGLQTHLLAESNGLRNEDLPNFEDPVPFLLVEDFNTEGLEGDPLEYEDPPESDKKKHNFFWFWRNIGRSGKGGQDRGRWGIGKTVFPASSLINTFYGFSIRESNKSPVLMGQSILKIHKIEGEENRINPYGDFGLFADDEEYFVTPIVDESDISKFTSTFNTKRNLSKYKKSGLSVLIPFPSPEITSNEITKSVVIQYFYAILAYDLVVEIIDHDQ